MIKYQVRFQFIQITLFTKVGQLKHSEIFSSLQNCTFQLKTLSNPFPTLQCASEIMSK